MPHLHDKPGQHDHTISAYIIRTDFDEPKVMFHLHKKLRKYIQFGGHIELNETPWQAIEHEIKEEAGYDLGQLMLLQPKQRITSLTGAKLHPVPVYVNTHNFNETHFHTDSAYVFKTDQSPAAGVSINESTDIILLSRQELIDLPVIQTFESVREPALFALDVCLTQWDAIDPTTFA